MKQVLLAGVGIVIIGAGAVYFVLQQKEGETPVVSVASFEECASAGYPIMESYPRQCKTLDGKTFVEDIGNELEKGDLIRVINPRPNQTISSPLVLEGEARGTWFFEASFPIKLLDGNGKEITYTIAQAQGEWMTEEFVPFLATLEFTIPDTDTGTLIFEKDNPSGLPEHADALRMPVSFHKEISTGACVVTGCSSQVCAEEDVITTCEYRSEYACYKSATCERQTNGECGWT